MKARTPGSRFAVFGFAFALLLKAAIPLFATWSAQLQGKSVAEVCTVYGVALPGVAARGHASHADDSTHARMSADVHAMHATGAVHATDPALAMHDHVAMHAGHALHADAMLAEALHPSTSPGPSDAPGPHEPGGHGGDHCVLTALVAFAFAAALGPALPVAGEGAALAAGAGDGDPIGLDASSRWAARLRHGPPTSS